MRFPDFAWGSGEEASDPIVLYEGAPVRVDQLARSGHLAHQDRDLADVAALGLDVWRYGMPWRLVERSPGSYDWTLWDRALAACARHGLHPVIDLCHFGLPDHYPGFCDPAWVEGFVRYVEAFLARYRAPLWFTPVNEPYVTALHSGLLGLWNDRRSDRQSFGLALAHCVLADLEALARIRADRDGWLVGAEGFPCPVAATAEEEARAASMRALAWLTWDLHCGRDPDPGGAPALDAVPAAVRARIDALATTRNVIAGHDVYPIGIQPVGGGAALDVTARATAYAAEARRWYARYGVDFWVSETSNLGLAVSRQSAWLEALAEALRALRAGGVPVRGLCWYIRGDQYDWERALVEPVGRVTEVGLFDAERRPRPVIETLRRLRAGGGP